MKKVLPEPEQELQRIRDTLLLMFSRVADQDTSESAVGRFFVEDENDKTWIVFMGFNLRKILPKHREQFAAFMEQVNRWPDDL